MNRDKTNFVFWHCPTPTLGFWSITNLIFQFRAKFRFSIQYNLENFTFWLLLGIIDKDVRKRFLSSVIKAAGAMPVFNWAPKNNSFSHLCLCFY